MKCKQCGHENLIKAKYCSSCGHAFTEEERQKTYNATIYGKINLMKKAKSWITLSAITSHPVFRILVLAGIIFFGFFSVTNQGTKMKLLQSDEYEIVYNKTRNEYYLFTDLDSVHLQIYLPGEPEGIRVDVLADNGTAADTKEYEVTEAPVLEKKLSYYLISGLYENGKEQQMRIGVFDADRKNMLG